ncbi:hypothetical protein BX616_006265 [Lobosporangium transversale]|uniref:Uncharacterized protein n=1 Tax=Lobosporangium transversale TaxID=64571 RepID=A0A1Y2G9P0_9FUNG|nr:hypothetical protein BCR41DRAFT_375812 [Lobosporangium transversale]KAF9918735.1 hypothetical protein BX616_006265 [Lobosporangium transversale]ORY96008.1 hypothetical protein BCR41DRAFT_375812 [Lobosporangium transversale]|eukprot:XP_021875445.1 hypothetical protein BCR41DRAFT_375812 [Lobosporangium transversale]
MEYWGSSTWFLQGSMQSCQRSLTGLTWNLGHLGEYSGDDGPGISLIQTVKVLANTAISLIDSVPLANSVAKLPSSSIGCPATESVSNIQETYDTLNYPTTLLESVPFIGSSTRLIQYLLDTIEKVNDCMNVGSSTADIDPNNLAISGFQGFRYEGME